VLGTLLLLALTGNGGSGAAASVPATVFAVPLLIAPVAASAALAAMPLAVPAPFALLVLPLLWLPALVGLSHAFP
jgi:hypothetical protein